MPERNDPPESQESIGRRLRETREALDLSPREFYEAVGFSRRNSKTTRRAAA